MSRVQPVQDAIQDFGNAVSRVSVCYRCRLWFLHDLHVLRTMHIDLLWLLHFDPSSPASPCFPQVTPLLSHPNDEIVREVLAFLKTIMFSGNRHVQEGMAHLLSTREERLFTTMQGLFTNAAITHRERYAGECILRKEEYM